jgi:hypothetical protein
VAAPPPQQQADYRQTGDQQVRDRQAGDRRAGAHAYDEAADARGGTRRRYYGMAGTLMILSGMLTFFIGITGVIRGIFFNTVATYPFYFSVRSRGVLLLVIGAVAFVAGMALLAHVPRAREVALVVALASAVANFMFLPFYPFWSIVVLILDVIIIWELAREGHGRQLSRLLPSPARGIVAIGCAPCPCVFVRGFCRDHDRNHGQRSGVVTDVTGEAECGSQTSPAGAAAFRRVKPAGPGARRSSPGSSRTPAGRPACGW